MEHLHGLNIFFYTPNKKNYLKLANFVFNNIKIFILKFLY